MGGRLLLERVRLGWLGGWEGRAEGVIGVVGGLGAEGRGLVKSEV